MLASHHPKLRLLKLTCALGVALALGQSVANAAHRSKKPRTPARYAAQSVPCRGANLFHCGPIYNGNDYLGDDPDPFIRLMIQRDLGAKYGGPD